MSGSEPGEAREGAAAAGEARAKRAAARAALALVEPNMKLGLGTGSTAEVFVDLLAAAAVPGLVCAATSERTARRAAERGLAVRDLDALGRLDLTVDGADEIDGALRLIKGGGGALLREKIVASASERMVVIAETRKAVAVLGAFPLPVEVVRFGQRATEAAVRRVLVEADVDARKVVPRLAADGAPFLTDEGHHILDLHLGRIGDPAALAAALVAVPGVVEHGLFLGLAERAFLGRADGSVMGVAAGGEPGLSPGEARAWAEELTRNLEQ